MQANGGPTQMSGRKKALLCACNYFGTSNQLGGAGGLCPVAPVRMSHSQTVRSLSWKVAVIGSQPSSTASLAAYMRRDVNGWINL